MKANFLSLGAEIAIVWKISTPVLLIRSLESREFCLIAVFETPKSLQTLKIFFFFTSISAILTEDTFYFIVQGTEVNKGIRIKILNFEWRHFSEGLRFVSISKRGHPITTWTRF